jgi:hypothetical protein
MYSKLKILTYSIQIYLFYLEKQVQSKYNKIYIPATRSQTQGTQPYQESSLCSNHPLAIQKHPSFLP